MAVTLIRSQVDEDDTDFVWARVATQDSSFDWYTLVIHPETSDIDAYIAANEASIETDILNNGSLDETLNALYNVDNKRQRWLNSSDGSVDATIYSAPDSGSITVETDNVFTVDSDAEVLIQVDDGVDLSKLDMDANSADLIADTIQLIADAASIQLVKDGGLGVNEVIALVAETIRIGEAAGSTYVTGNFSIGLASGITLTAALTAKPASATNDNGIEINMPTGSTGVALEVQDNGTTKLTIKPDGDLEAYLLRALGDSTDTTFTTGAEIALKNALGRPALSFHRDNGNRGAYLWAHESNGLYIVSQENLPIRFYTNNTEYMRLTEAGRLGIGIDAPDTLLHAKGSAVEVRIEATDDNPTIRFLEPGAARWLIQFVSSGDDRLRLLSPSGNEFQFNDDGSMGEDWTVATLNTGGNWAEFNAASVWGSTQYRKVADRIELRGMVKRTSGTNTTILTLPAGYRPVRQEMYSRTMNNGSYVAARIDITTAGVVTLVHDNSVAAISFLSLHDISFSTKA